MKRVYGTNLAPFLMDLREPEMVVLMATKRQQYNDGEYSNVYKVGNVAQPGNMPKEGLTLKLENP